jgi:hypothetical protein
MAPTDRPALEKLAAIARYTDEHLTLIARANMPHYRPGDELTDTQISALYSAAEMCYESGLRGAAVAATIERHQNSSAADWRDSFWQERLRRAQEREALPAPLEPQPVSPPPAPVPAPGSAVAGERPGQTDGEQANVSSGAGNRPAQTTASSVGWAGEVPIALDGANAAMARLPGPIAPEPVPEPATGMPSAIEPQPPPDQRDTAETAPVPEST